VGSDRLSPLQHCAVEGLTVDPGSWDGVERVSFEEFASSPG
jgi:hypothetical protein